MNALYRFLFPMKPENTAFSLFLLALRLLIGSLFLMHGFQKLMNYGMLSGTFPDPLGVGTGVVITNGYLWRIGLFCSFHFWLSLPFVPSPYDFYYVHSLFCDTWK